MLFEFKPFFEKKGLTDSQKILLSDTFFDVHIIKVFFLRLT